MNRINKFLFLFYNKSNIFVDIDIVKRINCYNINKENQFQKKLKLLDNNMLNKFFMFFMFFNLSLEGRNKIDSSIDISLITGVCYHSFNFNIVSSDFKTQFTSSEFDLKNFCFGLKFKKKITNKKEIVFSTNYSYSNLGYNYIKYSTTKNEFNGRIKFNGLLNNVIMQYKLTKLLKLNFGLNNYINIKNKFDNTAIAKELNWYNNNEKSMMKKFSLALCSGFELNLLKKVSLECHFIYGLNSLIVLSINNDVKPNLYPQKLTSLSISINYKL